MLADVHHCNQPPMFWIAFAAVLSAPEPRYMWLSNDDTPAKELGNRSSVEVRLELTIAPNGRVQTCEIEKSGGDVRIDKYTCDLARRRALFRPAQAGDGAAVYGVYRIPIMWAAVPVSPMPSGDLAVTMNPAPKGVHLPSTAHVAFAVDASGNISECGDEPPSLPGMARNNATLVPIACDQILKNFAATPAKDSSGTPVPSVQNATVVFSRN